MRDLIVTALEQSVAKHFGALISHFHHQVIMIQTNTSCHGELTPSTMLQVCYVWHSQT